MLLQFLSALLEVRLQLYLMQFIVILSMVKPVKHTIELEDRWLSMLLMIICILFER
jgi:hypothetical protein